MNIKHTALFSGVWFVVTALASGAAFADVKTVTVEAEIAVQADAQATEAEAKRQARRKAVEEGAGVLVSSNSIMKNFTLMSDEIATSAKGVLTDEQWGPLTDGATSGTKKIKLTAKVSPEVVSDAICTVLKANHDPKIALVFVEKYGDEDKWNTERGLVEATFANAFVDSCFTLVESGVKVTEITASGDLPQATINEIVKNADAQYVVLGSGKFLKAKVGENSILGNTAMNSYSMSASLKLINTATNEIIAVSSKQLQVMGISPEKAIEANDSKVKKNLTGAILDDLIKKISERWMQEAAGGGARVAVQVQGMANLQASKAFKELVAKLNGKAEQRKIAGGTGSFDVTFDGGAERFAETIEGKKIGKFTVEVVEVTAGKVVLKMNG